MTDPPTRTQGNDTAVLGVLLMEFGDCAMLRRMLRGIKTRAEALAYETGTQTFH